MCMQDIVISKNCYTKGTVIAQDTPYEFPPNPDRIAITVCPGQGDGDVYISFRDGVSGTYIDSRASWRAVNQVAVQYYGVAGYTIDYKSNPGMPQSGFRVYGTASAVYVTEHLMGQELSKAVRKQSLEMQRGNQ